MTRRQKIVAAVAAAFVAVTATGAVLAVGRDSTEPAIIGESFGALEPAPALSGTDPITGNEVSLADFAGKPVVVNIWADWCPGCRQEAPALRQLAEEHPEAAVLGIDFQDTVAGARRFYEEFDLSHPSIFDPDGRLATKLGLIGMPTTIFLDDRHRIVTRIVGETDLAGFELGLERAKQASAARTP